MDLSKNLFFAVILFTLVAFMISFLPVSSWQGGEPDLPVFLQSMEDLENGLVHFLVTTHFDQRIKRVQLKNEELFLDFVNEGQFPEQEVVIRDLARFLSGTFDRFVDIKDIWVRVVFRDQGKERLLIGILASRDQYKKEILNQDYPYEKLLQSMQDHFQISYGTLWENQYNTSSSP
jgi:hypothetical protein